MQGTSMDAFSRFPSLQQEVLANPNYRFRDNDQLKTWLRRNIAKYDSIHNGGTCCIGKVVDNEYKVKGTQNVRVADLSVLPAPSPGNPMGAAYQMGCCLSYILVKEKKGA